MEYNTIDLIVRRIVNAFRAESSEHVERILNGNTPGDEYFTYTGYLRGLATAEELAKKVCNDLLKEEEDLGV